MTYEEIVSFHGHECPGLAIGYRMATAVVDELKSIRAEDEELVAIVENDACGVDALQCVTGCTFGKGNLLFRDYGKQVYTVYSRMTRTGVRVLFHGNGITDEMRQDRTAFTSSILTAPVESILSVTQVSVPEPEPARVRKSVPCSICGEAVMETRTREMERKPVCIPCSEKQ
jgi:formylmethanofuran dehydrogenase subunit E